MKIFLMVRNSFVGSSLKKSLKNNRYFEINYLLYLFKDNIGKCNQTMSNLSNKSDLEVCYDN